MNYYKLVNVLFSSLMVILLVLISTLSMFATGLLFSNPSAPLLGLLIGMIVGSVASVYLYVIITIPGLLTKEFDGIKNRLALGEFKSVEDFQNEVGHFLVKFFRFPGMTVTGGQFRFKGCELLNIDTKADYSEIEEGREIRAIKQKGVTIIYVPVIMGDEFLGDFCLEVNTLSKRLFKAFISDFENFLLDDLLKIVYLLNK